MKLVTLLPSERRRGSCCRQPFDFGASRYQAIGPGIDFLWRTGPRETERLPSSRCAAVLESWVQGFVSGLNASQSEHKERADYGKDIDSEGLFAFSGATTTPAAPITACSPKSPG